MILIKKLKNLKINRNYWLIIYLFFATNCLFHKEEGSLYVKLYNSYDMEREFLFYEDTILFTDNNENIILKRYVRESHLFLDSLKYGNYILKFKNIYGEVEKKSIKITKMADTLNVDLAEHNWQEYTENLITTSLQSDDTLRIIGGINVSKPIPQNYPQVQIWKTNNEYFVKLPKINKDSSDGEMPLIKRLGSQIDDVKKVEIELKKINKLPISCSQTTDYYFITPKDTLHTIDGTCSWNGLSELYYILNGFTKK
ncbi:MAG: hypothetical protein MUE81_10265 [Thermoflexibacter sp.]|jgi:hypothetical protein|nr:hypothetical protein [Thermoflexibacter sp.]